MHDEQAYRESRAATSAGIIGGLGHCWKEMISNRCSRSRRLNRVAVLRQKSHPPTQMSQCCRSTFGRPIIPVEFTCLIQRNDSGQDRKNRGHMSFAGDHTPFSHY
jgi:hypothetical protein